MSIKKNFIAFLLLSSLLGVNATPLYSYDFYDVKKDSWASNYINDLSNKGILTGYSDRTFRPSAPVTRAEFATMLIKALEKDNIRISNINNFRDVNSNHESALNIQIANQLGLIPGYSDRTFKPNDYVTRNQLLAVYSKAVNSNNLSKLEATQILDQFCDSDQIQDWAKRAVASVVMGNIHDNYPSQNLLSPKANATRAEVAGMLFNMRKHLSLTNSYSNYPPVNDIIDATYQGAASNIVIKGSIATIQQNSVFPAVVHTPISTITSKVGDPVMLKTNKNLTTSKGVVLIPSGSLIRGEVLAVQPARYANRSAQLNIKFTNIEFPNRNKYPLQASIATEDGMIVSGSLKSKVAKESLKSVEESALEAGLGSVLGSITGNTGKGAIYGTDFGGGLGILSSILLKGGEIELPSGEPVFIKLDQPLSIDTRLGKVVNN